MRQEAIVFNEEKNAIIVFDKPHGGEIARDFFECFSRHIDEVRFEFKDDHLIIKSMDRVRVILFKIQMAVNVNPFGEFSVDVRLRDLVKALGGHKAALGVSNERPKGGTKSVMKVRSFYDWAFTDCDFPLVEDLEPEFEDIPMKNLREIKYSHVVEIPARIFSQVLENMGTVSDPTGAIGMFGTHFILEEWDDKVYRRTTAPCALTIKEKNGINERVSIDPQKIIPFAGILKHLDGKVTISMGGHAPIKIEFEVPQLKATVESYTAPRVNESEYEED